jgi:DNA-binding response OmpR family regulator
MLFDSTPSVVQDVSGSGSESFAKPARTRTTAPGRHSTFVAAVAKALWRHPRSGRLFLDLTELGLDPASGSHPASDCCDEITATVVPLRGASQHLGPSEDGEPRCVWIHAGALSLCPEARLARVKGVNANLTVIEFRLLLALVERGDVVQSRRDLLCSIWGSSGREHTRKVDTHVRRLRHKLADLSECIETVRGVGYRFMAPGSELA